MIVPNRRATPARGRSLTKYTVVAALVTGLVTTVGCFGDGKIEVSGKVSVAGQPIEQGTIRFAPADGKGPTDGASIAGGKYSVELTPGSKKVHIESSKKVGEKKQNPDDPSSPILPDIQVIFKADVTAEVTASRSDLNFDLPAP